MSLPKICWCRCFLLMHEQLEGQWNWYAWVGPGRKWKKPELRTELSRHYVHWYFYPKICWRTYLRIYSACWGHHIKSRDHFLICWIKVPFYYLFYPYFISNMKKFTVDKINYVKDHSNSQEPTDRSAPEIADHTFFWPNELVRDSSPFAWLISFCVT